jgi:hypothetical protein
MVVTDDSSFSFRNSGQFVLCSFACRINLCVDAMVPERVCAIAHRKIRALMANHGIVGNSPNLRASPRDFSRNQLRNFPHHDESKLVGMWRWTGSRVERLSSVACSFVKALCAAQSVIDVILNSSSQCAGGGSRSSLLFLSAEQVLLLQQYLPLRDVRSFGQCECGRRPVQLNGKYLGAYQT